MGSGRWATLSLALLAAFAAPWPSRASADDVVAVNLEVVGRTDLGGGGPFDDVAVVGSTAVVATGGCPGGSVTAVDVKDPRRPAIAAVLSLPPGTAAADLDAEAVVTSSFSGDLVAVALTPCGAGPWGGVAYYDLTDPRRPRLLAEGPTCDGCLPGTASVSIGQRRDGRVLALRSAGPGAVAVDEVTDPVHPVSVARWSAPAAVAGGCLPIERSRADLYDDGERALVVFTDGRVYDVDLTRPAAPSDSGPATSEDPAGPTRSTYGTVMPVGSRTLAVVAAPGPDGACTGPGAPGLRLLELSRELPPREVDPVRFTSAAVPGRLVASGELLYVAWGGDGLRVVDLGEVRAKAVAQFVPERPAVVGVDLLDDHLVVVDRNSGLYVLERPDEGGARSSFWSQFVGLLPYLGGAAVMTAALVVPRLAMGRAAQRTGAPSPTPEPAPRRVA